MNSEDRKEWFHVHYSLSYQHRGETSSKHLVRNGAAMSVIRMSAVWKESQHKANDLLLLLALADAANDEGYCWPSVDTLAEKTRIHRSTVLRAAKRLENSGEIYIQHNRRHGNKYLVLVGLTEGQIEYALKKHFGADAATVQQVTARHKSQTATNGNKSQIATSEVAHNATSEVALVRLDPSIIHQEPSKTLADAPGGGQQDADPETMSTDPTQPESSPIQDSPQDKQATTSPTPHQAMFEAICQAFELDWSCMTKTKRRNIGRVANEVRAAGATPADIPPFVAWCKKQDWSDFTENVLVTRWDDFKATRRARQVVVVDAGTLDADREIANFIFGKESLS